MINRDRVPHPTRSLRRVGFSGSSRSFVIPSEANPDFLSRRAGHFHVCAFPLKKGA
jgi:hypothetical protein